MRKLLLRPVKVTAWLDSPLALSQEGAAPRLDAVIESAMSRRVRTFHDSSNGRHWCDKDRVRGSAVLKPGQIPIPIERKRVDGLPIPLCSDGIWNGQQRVEHFNCKFPNEAAALLEPSERSVMRPTGGVFKSFHLPLRVVDCDRVVWFAVIREPKTRLRHELRNVHFLGKKTSQGYGSVSRWDVEDADGDHSWWSGGVLMRPLPASVEIPDDASGFRRSFGGACGPYWDRTHWREIIVPC